MKAIVAYTEEEYAEMHKKWQDLKSSIKGVPRTELFADYRKSSGYARYNFSGTVTDKLVELIGHEPTGDEIIMIVDNGFSHFGAHCTLNGRAFSGYVYTD